MIKLRVEGQLNELEEYIEYIKKCPDVEVLNIADPKHSQGFSQYFRSFIELNLKKEEDTNDVF